MKLTNETEFTNTQQKLLELEELIKKREQSPDGAPAHELSLESMRRFAKKLRAEIEEYQNAHQGAH